MLIFWDQRLVFLATPKAGSTAIAMALESLASVSIQRPEIMKHTNIAHFHRHMGPWLEAQAGRIFHNGCHHAGTRGMAAELVSLSPA